MKIKKRTFFLSLPVFLLILIGMNIHTGIPVEDLYAKYKTPESGILEVEGMPLHYRVTGEGPPLVLIHGVASSLHTWKGWHKALSGDFKVISFDVPSFGLTGPNPQNDYSVAMYMRVIDALLDHLEVDTTYMAGNSFGGYLTWNYAHHNPGRLHKIALLNAGGLRADEEEVGDFGMRLIVNPWTQNITHYFTPKMLVRKSVRNVYGDPALVTDDLVQTYYDMLMRKGNREGFSEVMGTSIVRYSESAKKLKEIELPALILWGSLDRVIPLEKADLFQDLLPDSELIVYKDIGHIPMEECPERSAEDVMSFFLR